ncbi:MAG: transcriptional regulator [candidate division CPR2 bacterium GW2011_GWC1_41_48]|uniref:Probable transcriptional regulatory protein UU65_C0008G0003 n=1 Tax=candidate division CPR2 bacterium GW2011_GWC1_41_48 TaxID=1618344 RepID=A0A0G0YG72_UNCC2|nr:MAG: transcriptional regulator [candidate division CPR2 bacterium GW2011_GWC2_39_35]KKR27744.1 MAG: transcriptional regulator [candidate division CPR2 bacterium GW2011_GWD2_39_7]KKR27868.1 MAG: transcriptional regulator [candidate division CPR2 bacterium GW2011_GWD1_39_7]KKS08581.1 MAG: transcriptional regulator [candidate division CPR2 bacterium GW2011_GWC1_41_48]OGB60054.1 MAG: transcriptional regulator [candidate division CPR2 bacterium GWD1_39_7]OGB71806.1 MAG: transcriptional regulator
MSGHSKWAGIKHKKAIVDAKRSKSWTKVANMITVAARGGGDPTANFKLRLAIDKAKEANMPKENVDRAIKRGTGELKGAAVEEIRYEGYGPGGVAVIADAATDNRNRTAGEVRAAFSKHGGKMGESGSVGWMFDEKGQILVFTHAKDKEELMLQVIDLGAEDVEESTDEELIIYVNSKDLEKVEKNLLDNGVRVDSAEVSLIPKNEVKVEDERTAAQILKLMDALEEIEDVTDVVSNFNIPDVII